MCCYEAEETDGLYERARKRVKAEFENEKKLLMDRLVVLMVRSTILQAHLARLEQVLATVASTAPPSLPSSSSPNLHEYAPASISESVASDPNVHCFIIYKQSGKYPDIKVLNLTDGLILDKTMAAMKKFVQEVNPNMETEAAVVPLHVGDQKVAYFLLDLRDGSQFRVQRRHLLNKLKPYREQAGGSQRNVGLCMILFPTREQAEEKRDIYEAEENKPIYELFNDDEIRVDNTKDADV